jgi:hypothetical protein
MLFHKYKQKICPTATGLIITALREIVKENVTNEQIDNEEISGPSCSKM